MRYPGGATLAAAVVLVSSAAAQAPAAGFRRPADLPPPGGSVQTEGGRGRGGLRPPPVTGPAPRLANGRVDFSGVWRPDNNFVGDISRALKPGEKLIMLPGAEKLFKSRKAGEDPEANCLPTGVPRMAPYPWSVVETPKYIYFLFEGNIHSYRQIFLDGRKHTEDPDPTWYGESIGHWEGDTLVVDTIGFNDKFWFDFAGHPHTEKLHTIERYSRPDLGTLIDEVTIDDPGAYEKPFTLVGRNRLDPKGEIMEYICQENNQDPTHIVGPARSVN
jgi:hypothetical protein